MDNKSLCEFNARALAKGRISFGDVRRLQRDIMPNGIGSRDEAELLLALDGQVGRRDPEWTRWLIAMVVDFVVWAERPTGVVDESTASWLASALRQHHPSKGCARAPRIAREIVEEAQAFQNEALLALAGMCHSSKPGRRTPSASAPSGPCEHAM
jgi:hypothetical protein